MVAGCILARSNLNVIARAQNIVIRKGFMWSDESLIDFAVTCIQGTPVLDTGLSPADSKLCGTPSAIVVAHAIGEYLIAAGI